MSDELTMHLHGLKYKGQQITQYINIAEGLYVAKWNDIVSPIYISATLAGNIIVEGPPQWLRKKYYDIGDSQNPQYLFIWGPFYSRDRARFVADKVKQHLT